MNDFIYPLPKKTPLTEKVCYGVGPKPITLSWSRLSDWMKCNYRAKLIIQGKKSKLFNARNTLAGKVADLCMREALEEAPKDSQSKLLEISLKDLMAPLPEVWNRSLGDKEENTIFQWNGLDPEADQKKILASATEALKKLHPILEDNLLGRRFIPEFRPKTMPIFGIPGPDGEPVFIRLYLAVDCAVQIAEDPDDPTGIGSWGLYDLKTTSTEEYLDKTLPQLVFYDLAFNAMTGKNPVDHALWAPLVNPPVRPVLVDDEYRMKVTNWIVSYCHGVWAGKDDFTDDETNCYSCPTKKACPKVTLPISKDEQGLSRFYFGDDSGGMLHG